MTEPITSVAIKVWRGVQWLLAGIVGLVALLMLVTEGARLAAPGAPIFAYGVSVALMAAVAASLSPPLFFRFNRYGKLAAYFGIFVAMMFWAWTLGQLQDAYEATPEGAKQAHERQKRERADAQQKALQREQEALQASTQESLEKLEDIQEQQEDCLSWGGELKPLSKAVSEGLHNPDSFEHVSTEFIVPTARGYSVVMTFRAENGFGAVRTAQIMAKMEPQSCEITDVSEPQPI